MRLARLGAAAWMLGAIVPGAAAAQAPPPPGLDCALGFETLRADASALTGAELSHEGGFDVARLAAPDVWRAQFMFTLPGHPAHPAAVLRTLRKQVTEVWTSDSKGCGYGDQSQFAILMSDMKSTDTELTNASRAEVEREKKGRSPLAP